MSKREQAVQDFVRQVKSRTRAALLNYFISHGVWVKDYDLEAALELDAFQPFLNGLVKDLDTTSKAIRLASDIGSISLAEKEKAMKSVYELEARCKENAGDRGELHARAVSLRSLVDAWPSSPRLGGPFAAALLGCFLLFVNVSVPGVFVILVAGLFGVFKMMSYERRRKAIAEALTHANARFDALLAYEVTPRPAIPTEKDSTRSKAYAFAGVTALAAIAAVASNGMSSQPHSGVDHVSPVKSPASPQMSAQQNTSEPKSEHAQHEYAWLVGKYPSEVVNDKRFRAAFNHVPQPDWRKIAERLVVAHDVIRLKDGFLFAEGCMSHQCASDQAAFAINETTSKGVIAYVDGKAGDTGLDATKTFVWRDTRLSETPLADWVLVKNAAHPRSTASVANTSSSSIYKTSFDCTKSHSDAERLVCGDAELAADDVQLSTVYAKAKAAAIDPNAFVERTRAQWNYREQTCHDKLCLQRWYADQRIALTQIAQTGHIDEQ